MRQAVEGTGDNCTHPVYQRGIYALLRRDAHIGFAERIERDHHATRGRTGQGGEYVGCHRPIASAKAGRPLLIFPGAGAFIQLARYPN
jgi:hypothetical protein